MKVKENKNYSSLIWIEKISVWLDSKYKIPGTNFKFGLDPIIGLIPILGDITTFAVSCGLLLFMIKNGASRKVVILMLGNIILDTVIGAVPLIGNIFDFAFKANSRNIRILRRHYEEGKYQGKGTGILIIAAAAMLALLILIAFILAKMGAFILELFHSF